MLGVRIAGTGSFVPEHVVTNDMLGSLIERFAPGKGAEWAFQKLGIRERRFMVQLEPETGHPLLEADELEIATCAARAALNSAGVAAESVDGLWYISCTQPEARRHFSRTVFEIHRRLGLRAEAFALEMDAGCGGAVHTLAHATQLLRSGELNNVLIVAANVPSQYYTHWETYAESGAWLSMYLFADGAGSVLLRRDIDAGALSGIQAVYTAIDPGMPLMEFTRPYNHREAVYLINARGVALSFRRYARLALEGLHKRFSFRIEDVDRFYFHQVNGHVLHSFLAEMEIPIDRAAIHVDRYGNMAAAATLVLLDEDLRCGNVGPGDLCIFCTVGAGAQYGALAVRL